ncbi:MAG: aminoacyl-tRNA hydrolase [Candidatus Nanogingivalis sp.]
MKIILFQGNFPEKYAGTRHNVAFAFADFLAEKFGAKFVEKAKFRADLAEISLSGEKILLVKPRTYYNETGFSARALCDFYKVDFRNDFLAIHDDSALDFGVVRTRKSGSDAGNNGLKSLISVFGKDFPRVKIGIANDFLAKMDSADFVLAKFSKAESEKLPQIFEICESFVVDFSKDKFENTKRSI